MAALLPKTWGLCTGIASSTVFQVAGFHLTIRPGRTRDPCAVQTPYARGSPELFHMYMYDRILYIYIMYRFQWDKPSTNCRISQPSTVSLSWLIKIGEIHDPLCLTNSACFNRNVSHMSRSINGGSPSSLDGLFHGTSETKIADLSRDAPIPP